MVTLKIAFRSAFRQKRRTILTALTVVVAFALASISIGWSDGTYSYIINMFTRNRIGHIQIHYDDYLEKPSIYKTIDDYQKIGDTIANTKNVEEWAPRIYSAGLASVKEKSMGISIAGVDPKREVRATKFDKKIVSGRLFSATPSKEAIIGEGLAKSLKADLGSELVIVTQGADGSIANDLYTIVGILESGDEMTDRLTCYMHIQDAQKLLVLEDQIHEIIVIISKLRYLDGVTKVLEAEFHDLDLDIAPWNEVAKSFYHAMKVDQEGMWIMIFVIVLIVAVEVLNTVLMSVLERTREYGMLRAVGTRPGQIITLVVFETFIIAIASCVVGSGLGILVNHVLSIYGISLPQSFTYGGLEFKDMYAEVNARSVYIPAITIILSATVVSFFPAIKAARTEPAKAMRIH